MSQQGLLFDTPAQPKPQVRQPTPPVLPPVAAPVTTETADLSNVRPWRAPTAGEEACHGCGRAACYADGPTFWCRGCVPAGFLPGGRGR